MRSRKRLINSVIRSQTGQCHRMSQLSSGDGSDRLHGRARRCHMSSSRPYIQTLPDLDRPPNQIPTFSHETQRELQRIPASRW